MFAKNSKVFNLLIILILIGLSSCIGPRNDVFVKPATEVDEIPELVGGVQYIIDELKYPHEAKENGVEGRVLIQFVVDNTGEVKDAQVLEGIGSGCDEEALRVMESAKFSPGRLDGEAVPVQMIIPIQFKI